MAKKNQPPPPALTPAQQDMQRAVLFAARAHQFMFRKGNGLPYIVHPLAVLKRLGEWGVKDPVMLKAAACHDIKEDCPHVTEEEMVAEIGEEANALVHELSFFPDPKSNVPVPTQKEKYIETFIQKSVMAIVVKCADRAENTWDFYHGGDAKYAAVYWKKGQPVFNAAASREEEITALLGNDVILSIKFARDSINRVLVR